MPEISIIVPVYRVEKYIRRCVDSILNQTFHDFELILVNDGSPDNCGVICDEYAKQDSRICVIHKKNGGLSSARNAGLDIAQGEYILFCDSDDYVAKDWCEKMLRAITMFPQCLVTSDLLKVHEETRIHAGEHIANPVTEITFYQIVQKGLSGYVCNKIFSNVLIRDNNLRFDEERKFAEDVPFVMEYCKLCKSYVLIDEPLYYYVQREDSILHTVRFDILEHQLFTFYIRIPFLSEEEIPEYCDNHLFSFIHYFEAVLNRQNTMRFLDKLRYNQRMIRSKEFRFCLDHATGKNENPWVMKILRTHNYYLFWLFNQIVQLKGKLRRKKQ